MEMSVLSDEQIDKVAEDAFSEDALLEHYVESRGKWERLAPFLLKAQQKEDLRRFVEWGDRRCTKPEHIAFEGHACLYRLCSGCWSDLKKLAEGEG